MKQILLLIVFLFPLLGAFAQQSNRTKKAEKLTIDARMEASRRNYPGALQLCDEAIKKDPNYGEAYFIKGKVLVRIGEFAEAIPQFEKASELLPVDREHAEIYQYLGRYYMDEGDYKKAKDNLTTYIRADPTNEKGVAKAKELIEDCDYGMKTLQVPDQVEPVALPYPLNGFQYQYFPVLTGDQEYLFFTARSDRSTEEILVSRKIGTEWTKPVSVSDRINSREFNEGTCSISADGRTLVYTSCNNPRGVGRCDLFISYRQGKEWSKPASLGRNINTKHWESQPSLSADGRLLFFSSDRPGGVGKMDIWYSRKNEKGIWERAKNVGPPINTRGEEFSPFLHTNNQTLFYSTDGYKGMGGLDLVVSNKTETGWEKPQNLGYPLNTWKDEVGIFVASDGKSAFYSRTAKNQGVNGSLLFKVELPERLRVKKESYALKGRVLNAKTKAPLEASIQLIELESDTAIQSLYSDSVNGAYLIVLTKGAGYGLFVSKEGYLYRSINFDLKDAGPEGTLTLDIELEPVEKGATTQLNNIFFDFGSADLREESLAEIEELAAFMNQNKDINIEISAHTDDVGSNEDNLSLSKRRAASVQAYLVKIGIGSSRITSIGYGEEKPLVPNDTDENRQKNRRIEFRIL